MAVLRLAPDVSLVTGGNYELYVDMLYTTFGNKVEEPQKRVMEQRFQLNALVLGHLLERSAMLFHPASLQLNMAQQSCTQFTRRGETRSNLFWRGLMVERLYGAFKKSVFEYVRNYRSVRSDYGTKHAPAEIRELQGQLQAEDKPAGTVVGSVSAADDRIPATPQSPRSGISDSSDEEWVLFQVDGMGLNCHVTLGYVPLNNTERLMCGLAHIIKTELALGCMAYC